MIPINDLEKILSWRKNFYFDNAVTFGENSVDTCEKISEMKMWYKKFGENCIYFRKISESKMQYIKLGKNFVLGK